MFKITGPSSLRSIASGLVTVNNQAKLFAFISATDAILQLATAGIVAMIYLHSFYIFLRLKVFYSSAFHEHVFNFCILVSFFSCHL